MKLKVSFLASPSIEGASLFKKVSDALKKINTSASIENHKVDSLPEYLYLCENYDIVIIDATFERGNENIYACMVNYPFEHVLVVSRNKLPLGFVGSRRQEFVKQSISGYKILYNSPLFISNKNFDNDNLVDWISENVKDITNLYKTDPDVINHRKNIASSLIDATYSPEFGKAWSQADKRKNQGGEIFISYRNVPSKNTLQYLLKIKGKIEQGRFTGIKKSVVRLFEPGSLSMEVMSQKRRWQILSMIDRYIAPADELWIYETEEYYNSWWTLGELLTIKYRIMGESGSRIPILKLLKPNGTLQEINISQYLPDMTYEQKKRMARWYANVDDLQSDIMFYAMANIQKRSLLGQIISGGFKLFNSTAYHDDYVWSKEFWEHPVIDCHNCRNIGGNKSKFNVDDFLWTKGKWFTKLSPEEADHYSQRGEFKCPNCGINHRIIKSQNKTLYYVNPFGEQAIMRYIDEGISSFFKPTGVNSVVEITSYELR